MSTRVAVRKILAVTGRVSKSQTSLPVFKLKVRSSGSIRAFSRHLDHSRKEVVERIGVVQFALVNEAHEHVAHLGALLRPIKQGILPMQNGSPLGLLHNMG